MNSTAKQILEDEAGATAVEYALMVAAIAAVVVAIAFTLGTTVHGLFQDASDLWAAQR